MKIVDAAKDIVSDQGWNKVSIRNIASKINYSPPLLYSYFKNKDDILGELQKEGFKKLKKRYSSIAKKEKPKKAIKAISHEYVDFALKNSELFGLMFNLDGVTCNSEKGMEEMYDSRDVVIGVLAKVAKDGTEMADELYINWWSLVHGFTAIHAANYVQLSKKIRNEYLDNMIDRFVNSIS